MNDTSIKVGDCLGMGTSRRREVKGESEGELNVIKVFHTHV
jgi:hypothetical protein